MGFFPADTFTTVLSAEQALLVPLRRVNVYGAVPPFAVATAVTVEFWPTSIADGERTRLGATRAGLTVTTTEDDMELDLLELDTVPQYRIVEVGKMVKTYWG
jgi:hypothetical protein